MTEAKPTSRPAVVGSLPPGSSGYVHRTTIARLHDGSHYVTKDAPYATDPGDFKREVMVTRTSAGLACLATDLVAAGGGADTIMDRPYIERVCEPLTVLSPVRRRAWWPAVVACAVGLASVAGVSYRFKEERAARAVVEENVGRLQAAVVGAREDHARERLVLLAQRNEALDEVKALRREKAAATVTAAPSAVLLRQWNGVADEGARRFEGYDGKWKDFHWGGGDDFPLPTFVDNGSATSYGTFANVLADFLARHGAAADLAGDLDRRWRRRVGAAVEPTKTLRQMAAELSAPGAYGNHNGEVREWLARWARPGQ